MFSDLNLTQDVAGATFMAIATSSPELFVNIIGTFITESDLGVGTVVGSAVFNTLGVAACIGLAACKVRSLHQHELSCHYNETEFLIFQTSKRHLFKIRYNKHILLH